MTLEERIASLESRLATAEARIASLESTKAVPSPYTWPQKWPIPNVTCGDKKP